MHQQDDDVDQIDALDNTAVTIIDPLTQSLIDIEEFQSEKFEGKSPSILTLFSYQTNEKISFTKLLRRCTGIFYALLGSFLFTISGFVIKQLGVDFFDALLCRFIIQTLLLLIFISYKRYEILPGSWNLIILQIIRVILASSGLFLFYLSYLYIPLPDLTTVRYTQVIWTALLAMLIFHERIAIPTILAIILTIIGVVCVAQPTFLFDSNSRMKNINQTDISNEQSNKSSRFLGLILALACALSISGSIVLNKKLLVLKIPQSILMFHFSLLNLVILILNQLRNRFILQIYSHQTMFTGKYYIAASVALIQLFSSTITQKAIKLEHPSLISVVQSSDILFAIALQNLFTSEKSNWLILLGSTLVTTSIFLVGGHKLWKDRKK